MPQAAITTAAESNVASYHAHRPCSEIFAQIGPMTHSTNAENEPRNAMTVENWGTRMDTRTVRTASEMRSRMSSHGRGVAWGEVESVAATLEVGEAGREGEVRSAGLSIPSQISIVRLS